MEDKAVEAINKTSKYFIDYAKKFSKCKTPVGPLLNEQSKKLVNIPTEIQLSI